MHSPELIILPAFFLMLGFVVWTTVTAWQQRHRLRLQTDFNAKVIDRLGSIANFSEFASSDVGSRFLNSIVADAPKAQPGERILRATHIGIVLCTSSVGLLALARYFETEGRDAFTVVGVIALSLGVGFLISSAVTHRLSLALGLQGPDVNPRPDAARKPLSA
jgi:hypothetical protein